MRLNSFFENTFGNKHVDLDNDFAEENMGENKGDDEEGGQGSHLGKVVD